MLDQQRTTLKKQRSISQRFLLLANLSACFFIFESQIFSQEEKNENNNSNESSSQTPTDAAMPQEINLDDQTSSQPQNHKTPAQKNTRKKVKKLKGTKPKSSKSAPATPAPVTMEASPDELNMTDADVMENEAGDAEDATWESYKDGGLTGSMKDVTDHIKVQDIVEPPSVYHYAAFGKPDPFRPVIRTKAVAFVPTAQDLEVPILSALQTVGIENMTILGIWQGSDGRKKAMITFAGGSPPYDGDTKGYVVKVGDPIGNRGGIVQAIKHDGMVVREFEVLADGTRHFKDATLPFNLQIKIPQPPQGSWIFKPGLPQPIRKFPENMTNAPTRPAPLDPNTIGIPQTMLDSVNRQQIPQAGSQRFSTPTRTPQNPTPPTSGMPPQGVPQPQFPATGQPGGNNLQQNTGTPPFGNSPGVTIQQGSASMNSQTSTMGAMGNMGAMGTTGTMGNTDPASLTGAANAGISATNSQNSQNLQTSSMPVPSTYEPPKPL